MGFPQAHVSVSAAKSPQREVPVPNSGALAQRRAQERHYCRAALENRDVVEPAIDILMERHHISAATAFDHLVVAAQEADCALADAARWLLDADTEGHHCLDSATRYAIHRTGPHNPVHLTAATARLSLTLNMVGNAVVVHATGEVDMCTEQQFRATLLQGCALVAPAGALVVDLTGIQFLSAAGLSVLQILQWRCRAHRMTMLVVATSRSVLRPLQATGLDRHFDVRSSVADALRLAGRHPTIVPH